MSLARAFENIAALEAYLQAVEAIPARGGKVSIAGVAKAAGVDRQVLYRNPTAKALLEAAVAEKGLIGIETRPEDGEHDDRRILEQRIRSLEARNAALASENFDLKARLRRVEHIEAMLVTGRRVIP